MKRKFQYLAFAVALAGVATIVPKGMTSTPTSSRENAAPVRHAPLRATFSDPTEAIESISKLPDGERLPAQMRFIREWGRRDFAAARARVISSDESVRHDLLVALGRSAIDSRPHDVMNLGDEFAPEALRASFLSTMIQAWASSDPAGAVEWVEKRDSPSKGVIQTALVTEISQKDPPRAATYVAVSMEPGPDQDQAALTVAARWAALDPEAASAWALSLPESDLQQRVLAAVNSLASQ